MPARRADARATTRPRTEPGAMIYEYRVFLFERPELLLWPSMALSFTCLFVNLIADRSPERAFR
jgi:ABC-type dipeptide/oligopeptide/nickel transport system permease subunit